MNDPRIFSISKLNRIPNNLPYLLGIAYFFGFIIVNSYLSNFNFHSIGLLNTEYLTAGLIFSLIFGALFFSIYYSNKNPEYLTDNAYDFFLPALLRVFSITYSMSLFTIDYVVIGSTISSLIILITIFFLILITILNSEYTVKKMNVAFRGGLMFIYIFLSNTFVFIFCESCRVLMFIILSAGIGIIIVLSDIIDKKYHKVQIIGLIFIAISFASIFGTFVYDKIPNKYGGGKSYRTDLIIDSGKYIELQKILHITNDSYLNVEILFKTEKEFLVRKDSLVYTLNRSFFCGSKSFK